MTKPNSPIINIPTLLSETQYLQSKFATIKTLDSKQLAELYDLLIPCLIAHNHFYYLENKSIITDTEYDQLFDALKQIESLHPELIRDDSPTQRIVGQTSHLPVKGGLGGFDIQSGFTKSNHSSPILSLQNTYNAEEITDRYDSITKMLQKKIEEVEDTHGSPLFSKEGSGVIENLKFLLQPKYDGLSIVLTYTDGKLTKAVTRGDGYTGDDVTENVKTIKNIPPYLSPPDKGETPTLSGRGFVDPKEEKNDHGETSGFVARGEILMPKSVRKRLNTEREANGEEPFANTRNAAAGSLKLLDTNEVSKRGLVCYIYDVIQGDESIINQFPSNSFDMPPLVKGGRGDGKTMDINEILTLISNPKTKEELFKADIDFDGLVIKIADPTIRKLLGSTNHHPRRAIAYKFPAQQIATQIESIERQIGRTGILTPVANLTPKELSGVTISRVSLHNRDFIQSKDIHIHDRVRLQRSGEVIPYIVAVITDRRDGNEKKILSDTIVCPACGSHAIKIENEVGTKSNPEISTQFFCPNNNCPGILKEQLKHFVSKNCMNIASIGESLIDILVDQGLLHTLADLYTLTQSDKIFLLKRLPGIATKKIDTLINELEKSKSNELRRFLNALGIPGIGIKLAKELENALEEHLRQSKTLKLSNLNSFVELFLPDKGGGGKPEGFDLSSIHGIGETLIDELTKRFNDPEHIKLLQDFDSHDIEPQTLNSQLSTLNSKIVCITGTFPLSRSELEFYITHAGYTFSLTLTKSTDYLFIGNNAGSKKEKVGPATTIISDWTQICTMLDISIPLFESLPHPLDQGLTKGMQGGLGGFANRGEMQSLFS